MRCQFKYSSGEEPVDPWSPANLRREFDSVSKSRQSCERCWPVVIGEQMFGQFLCGCPAKRLVEPRRVPDTANYFGLREVEPMAGIEPATDGLRNRCSTAELHWRPATKKAEI